MEQEKNWEIYKYFVDGKEKNITVEKFIDKSWIELREILWWNQIREFFEMSDIDTIEKFLQKYATKIDLNNCLNNFFCNFSNWFYRRLFFDFLSMHVMTKKQLISTKEWDLLQQYIENKDFVKLLKFEDTLELFWKEKNEDNNPPPGQTKKRNITWWYYFMKDIDEICKDKWYYNIDDGIWWLWDKSQLFYQKYWDIYIDIRRRGYTHHDCFS